MQPYYVYLVTFTPVNGKVNRKRFQGTYGELNFTCFVKKVGSTKPVRLMRYQYMTCEPRSTIFFHNLWEKGNYLLSSSTKVTVPNWDEVVQQIRLLTWHSHFCKFLNCFFNPEIHLIYNCVHVTMWQSHLNLWKLRTN